MSKFHLPKLYRLAIKFPRMVVLLCILFGVLGFLLVQRLQFIADFRSLLPNDAESVRNLAKLEDNFGNLRTLVVTVEGNAPQAREFAEELSQAIRSLPEIRYVDYRGSVDFFLKRFWLYLSQEDLKEIEGRVVHSLELEKKGVSSTFSHLMDFADPQDRPDLTFSDIFDRYKEKFLGSQNQEDDADEKTAFETIWVKPKIQPNDLDYNRFLLDKIHQVEAQIQAQHPDFSGKVGYTGPYVSSLEETGLIAKEVGWVSILVTIALFLILVIYFRKLSSVILIGMPLTLGILWTGGLVYLVLGHLNIITGFGAAILAGLGSDYGIFLLTRFYQERGHGADFNEASRLAFENTGKATFGSMVTTVGAFAALLFSNFGVFFELGVLGVIGLLMNYLAMMLLLPSLLCLAHRWEEKGVFRKLKFLDFKKYDVVLARRSLLQKIFSPNSRGPLLIGFLLMIVLASLTIPAQTHIVFESGQLNTNNLPSNQLYSRVSEKNWGTLDPTVLLVEGQGEEKELVSKLNRLLDEKPQDQLVYNKVLGISSFIPEHQTEKRESLKEIQKEYEKLTLVNPDQKRKTLDSIWDTLKSDGVNDQNLPEDIRRRFVSPRHAQTSAVYLFPNMQRGSSDLIDRYYQGLQTLKSSVQVPFIEVDSAFIQREVTELIRQEAPRGMVWIMIFFCGFLLLTIRPFSRAMLIFAHLAASLVLLSGLLWILNIPLNVMNIAMIPIVLGTGIDCFIHFSHRLDEEKSLDVIPLEIPPIFVSSLTSIVGFAGLLLTSSLGLRSVGWVAVLGLILVTLVCAFIFPPVLLIFYRKHLTSIHVPRKSIETSS